MDILIEELHDHLYLKSPYCQGRWKLSTPEAAITSTSGNAMSLRNFHGMT
jgi:exocyst complex component 4